MIVELEIRSYVGTSAIGAKHYYAELKWDRPKKKGEQDWSAKETGRVYGLTTQTEADCINKLGWDDKEVKAGDTCFGWLTEEDAIKHGVEKFVETFNLKKDILVMYPGGNGGVCIVVVGPSELKNKIEPWLDACEALDWDWSLHSRKMEAIDKEFKAFWKGYEKTHKPRNVKYDQWSFKGKDLIGD
jgi:hypothetical protein